MNLQFKILLYSIILFLISCKNNPKTNISLKGNKNSTTTVKIKEGEINKKNILKYSNEDFDFILKDREDFNWLPKGVLVLKSIYLPNYNDIGNIYFYFVSKSGALKWQKYMNSLAEEGVNKELNRIKNLPLKGFKKEFDIYVFLIDKQYLQNTPEGMYQKEFFVREFYKYNTNNDSWVKIDSFIVNTKNGFIEERKWYNRKLKDILR